MTFSADEINVRDATAAFARRVLAPGLRAWEKAGAIPRPVLDEMGAAGIFGMMMAPEWGGSGASFTAFILAVEEIAACGGGISTTVHVHNLGAGLVLERHGTPAQKSAWLPRMAGGECIGAFCLTEPQAGSDASNLRTRAVRDGDHYVLNGAKQFITNARIAGVFLVVAVTEPAHRAKGLTIFIVPNDTPGLRVGPAEDKLGQRVSDTAQVFFEECRVPAANVLGTVDGGYALTLSMLSDGRVSVAAQAVGFARAAFEAARRYAFEREAFGKKIAAHQALAFRLADMDTAIEIARSYVHRVARMVERGECCAREASMAKLFATTMAERVCTDAIQIHGGYGYLEDYDVARLYRDQRVCQIYEGTNDMQRLIISRALAAETDLPGAGRGSG
ncbi:MAG: acyl-CoA dehydrogenase family protein [Gammaproteobacteria bacterium]|nr:acyl-CoA dehydrogenase family protein [Gammaproteobacteria bacterium]